MEQNSNRFSLAIGDVSFIIMIFFIFLHTVLQIKKKH